MTTVGLILIAVGVVLMLGAVRGETPAAIVRDVIG